MSASHSQTPVPSLETPASDSLSGKRIQVPVEAASPPRFDIVEERKESMEYLAEHGYVVIKGVATKDQVEQARENWWDFVDKECQPKRQGVQPAKKGDPSSWGDVSWPGHPGNGIVSLVNHSDLCWQTRLLPGVRQSFEAVWEDDDLLVSFDAGNVFRPWKREKAWMTNGGWWHVDQNALRGPHRQGRVCVQGLVTYYDATVETGGLTVIPKSHLHHDEVCAQAPAAKMKVDFVQLEPPHHAVMQETDGILVCAKAGDLILWDSRTIHCNSPALPQAVEAYEQATANLSQADQLAVGGKHDDIIRLVSYVCMVPTSFSESSDYLQKRELAFLNRVPTSHWPVQNLVGFTTRWSDMSHPDINSLPKEQIELILGKNNKYTSGDAYSPHYYDKEAPVQGAGTFQRACKQCAIS
mmetsp:Transcript_27044/g.53241  ORF Transcript_27044/g.53241 Transcript_27044/m.53241 type:complete len:411 (+) Transcript_27044:66-1298(+)